jgi:hypothetical protein
VPIVDAGVEQFLDLNDGHAALLGYWGRTETIMVEPPDKGEGCPPNLAGKVRDSLYNAAREGQTGQQGKSVWDSRSGRRLRRIVKRARVDRIDKMERPLSDRPGDYRITVHHANG